MQTKRTYLGKHYTIYRHLTIFFQKNCFNACYPEDIKSGFSGSMMFFGIFLLFTLSPIISYSQTKKTGVRTVCIDAGHGGKDPGCSGTKHKEKDVSLAVALKLGAYIEKNFPDVKVVYTRKTDVFVELQERANIANKSNSDLFICVHCNANPNKEAHGAETYVMGLKKAQGNLEIAKRENSSILLEKDYKTKYDGFDPNSDEAYIIFNLMQNSFLDQSQNLASKIQHYYKVKAKRVDKDVRQANFWVLWRTAMPSLLTEIGFLSNVEEEKFLGSDKGQDYVATSLFLAFRDYKNELEGTRIKFDDDLSNLEPYEAPKDTNPILKDTLVLVKPVIEKNEKDSVNKAITEVKVDTVKKKETFVPPPAIDAKITYRVQITSSDKKLANNSTELKGAKDIFEYKDGRIYKYAAGDFKKPEQAIKYQNELRKKGFKDAFVVAFNYDRRVSLEDAKKMAR